MRLAAALLFSAAVACQVQAQEALPQAVAVDAPGLKQRGAGTFRWFGLEVYAATLWSRGGPPDHGQPFAIALRYSRTLKGTAIAERSVEEMRNLEAGTPEQLRTWGAAMANLFPDVSKGTSLVGLNVPGEGARFYHDGRPIGTIPGGEFSRAFFSIWLHPKTSAPALRASLLGEG